MVGLAAATVSGDWSLLARRWELYRSAAPVFDQYGFRRATVDGLARACFMSPAGLYHYFPSKASFALFPLTTHGGLCQDWHRLQVTLPVPDPLFQIHAVIAFVVALEPEVRLAFRLSREMVLGGHYRHEVAATVLEARADWLDLARPIVPAVDEERAMDFFEGIVSVMAADVPSVDREADGVRRQMTDLSRGWVSGLGLSPADFDTAGHAYDDWATNQPDSTSRANLANARRISAGGTSPERAQKRSIQPRIRPAAPTSRSVVISVAPARSLKRVVQR